LTVRETTGSGRRVICTVGSPTKILTRKLSEKKTGLPVMQPCHSIVCIHVCEQ